MPFSLIAAHQPLGMRGALLIVLVVLAVNSSGAADHHESPFADLRLEVHGFVSFGYLQTWENDWLDDTTDGSADFHEAAINVIARPLDRLRIGAQLFERDLGRYDNGRVALDCAFVSWTFADQLEIVGGRIKAPLGLYNELRDVDAARTPVFLPRSVYALRSRDLYVSIDGGEAKGLIDLPGDMDLEYALYGGDKHIDDDTGTTTYISEQGFGDPVTFDIDWAVGGMAHLTTPVPGLGLRLSVLRVDSARIVGDLAPGVQAVSELDYWAVIGSLEYEMRKLTLAAEYSLLRGRGTARVAALGVARQASNNNEGAYVSATWRHNRWVESYLAGEAEFDDAQARHAGHAWRLVAACAVRPLSNWSLKLEGQYGDDTLDSTAIDNPDDAQHHWWGIALKTTVDF